jgi:uncharacterized protein YjiS (DUF1127 family)
MLDLFDTWRQRRRLRKTQLQLTELSDHLLADIGVTRADIIDLDSYRATRMRLGAGRR